MPKDLKNTKDLLCEDWNPNSTLSTLREENFDDDTMTIRDAAILYKKSRNGYGYSESAMEDNVRLSNGAFIYNDAHIKKPGQKHKKLTQVATISNPRRNGDWNVADVVCFPNDGGTTLYHAIKAKSAEHALSQEALNCGTVTRGKDTECVSIDSIAGYIVTDKPGTTTSFFEEEDVEIKTLEDLKSAIEEVYKELVSEVTKKIQDDGGNPSEIAKELLNEKLKTTKLESELDGLKKANADREADEKKRELEADAITGLRKAAAKDKAGLAHVLSEEMEEVFIKANASELETLTEEHYESFASQLPLLTDEPAPEPKKKPGAKSGSGGGGAAARAIPSMKNLRRRRRAS